MLCTLFVTGVYSEEDQATFVGGVGGGGGNVRFPSSSSSSFDRYSDSALDPYGLGEDDKEEWELERKEDLAEEDKEEQNGNTSSLSKPLIGLLVIAAVTFCALTFA